MVCVMVCVRVNAPFTVIMAMLDALYVFPPALLQTPCPGPRNVGKNIGLDVVSVIVPPRAKVNSDINGAPIGVPSEQSRSETVTTQVPSSFCPSPLSSGRAAPCAEDIPNTPTITSSAEAFKTFILIDSLLRPILGVLADALYSSQPRRKYLAGAEAF